MISSKNLTLYTALLLFSFLFGLGVAGETSAATLLPPATITVPASDANGSYVVQWSESPTAATDITYVLQEATNAAFTGVRVVPHTTVLKANITGRTTGQTYYYRVRAKMTGWTSSPWTVGENGCLVKIPAETPAGITVPLSDADGNYTVSWGASATPGVTYVLQEATNSTFVGPRVVPHPDSPYSASITGRTQGVTYYYRVNARKAGNRNSAWRKGANGCMVYPVSGNVSLSRHRTGMASLVAP